MKYKLIAIDFDGTLLSPSGLVTARTKAAVHRCVANGYAVCFATGRNLTESARVLAEVDHLSAAVFVGGAIVADTQSGRTLHRTLMHATLAREICGFFESHGHAVLALQDTEVAGFDYLISHAIEPNEATRKWLSATRATVQWADDLPTRSHHHTLRIGIVAEANAVREANDELSEKFGPRIVSHCIQVPPSSLAVLEIFDPAVNKWQGVMRVARPLGISGEEIIAVGDDVNDIAMVRNAALGIAMGNAHPRLAAVADRVIGSNVDDGLAEFLENLVSAGE